MVGASQAPGDIRATRPSAVVRDSTQRSSTRACNGTTWSRTRTLPWFDGEVRYGSLAAFGAGTYVFGDSALLRSSGEPAPMVALDLTHRRRVPEPPGGTQFLRPVAASDRFGIHVLWGHADPNAAARSGPPRLTELWSGIFVPGTGWFGVRSIFSAPRIDWYTATYDRAAGGGTRAAYFTAPIWDDRGAGILVVRAAADSVTTSVIRQTAAYAAIGQNAAGKLLLAVVGPDTTVQHDGNSVLVRQSSDDGTTWGPPRVVSRSGDRAATQVRVLAAGPRTWDLLWLQSLSDGAHPDVIRRVASGDDGATWSDADDLKIPDLVTLLRAASDRCGTLHVVVAQQSPQRTSRARLLYARLPLDSVWSTLSDPFPDATMVDPDLLLAGDGTIRLTAVGWLRSAGTPRIARTITASLTAKSPAHSTADRQ
jgi:hypothetical protein